MKPALLAPLALPAILLDGLEQHYRVFTFPDGPDTIDWNAGLDDVEGVVTNGLFGCSEAMMDRLPRLKVVSTMGAGYENVDVRAAVARGIAVTHAPGTNAGPVADHALGMALGLARAYKSQVRPLQEGQWGARRLPRPTLCGSTVGIIGLGIIGAKVAQRAAAFDATVLYHGRAPKPSVPYTYCADLLEMARASDFLIATCPGGPATHHLLCTRVFEALGPEGFVINVARGSVLATADLIRALDAGTIAGAGLDVLEEEPEPPAGLLRNLASRDNVVLTPHCSGRAPGTLKVQLDVLLQSLADGRAGRRPAMHVPLPA